MQNNPATMIDHASSGTGTRSVRKNDPFKEAFAKIYQIDDGRVYHPMEAFWRGMVDACPNTTIGGKACSGILPPAIEVAEEEFILCDPDTLDKKTPKQLTAKDWVIDSRRINNPKVGSLIVHRPKWVKWGGLLIFEIDRNVVPVEATSVITDILNIVGKRGVGSGRLHQVERKGWVGIRMGKFRAELK